MPTVTTAGDTPAVVPLSLLEALRNLDTPVGDGLEELAGEIVAKRFGLSGTSRASFYLYNTKEEVDVFIKSLARAKMLFDSCAPSGVSVNRKPETPKSSAPSSPPSSPSSSKSH